jgi:hypothetical protein
MLVTASPARRTAKLQGAKTGLKHSAAHLASNHHTASRGHSKPIDALLSCCCCGTSSTPAIEGTIKHSFSLVLMLLLLLGLLRLLGLLLLLAGCRFCTWQLKVALEEKAPPVATSSCAVISCLGGAATHAWTWA